MSKREILSVLKNKGLMADVDYQRSVPTPSGYAKGWDIFLTESSENKLFSAGFEGNTEPDCRTTNEVLEWVATLPKCHI